MPAPRSGPASSRLGFESEVEEALGVASAKRARAGRPRAGDRARAREPSPASRGATLTVARLAANQAPADECLEVGRKLSPPAGDRARIVERRAVAEHRQRAVQVALAVGSGAGSSSRSRRAACVGAPAGRPDPPSRARDPSSSARTISAGGRTTSRAATSSIASGRPSRRRQISCTDASASSWRTTPRAAASSTNSVVASSSESGSSGSTRSLESLSGVRLVASIWRSGSAVEQRRDVHGRGREVLEVVEEEERPGPVECCPPMASSSRLARLSHAERAGDRARHEVCVGHRGQTDEVDGALRSLRVPPPRARVGSSLRRRGR